MLSHLKRQKLAALKEKNIKLIFRLKTLKQVFKQNLTPQQSGPGEAKPDEKELPESRAYICFLFSWVPRQVRETERKKLQNF